MAFEALTQYTITVNEHSYVGSKKLVKTLISMAKEKYKKENKNAIVALEKGKIIEMRNDVFESRKEMLKQIQEYNLKGLLVHCVKEGNK